MKGQIVAVRVTGMAVDHDESVFEENDVPEFFSVMLIYADGNQDHYDDHSSAKEAVIQAESLAEENGLTVDIAWLN